MPTYAVNHRYSAFRDGAQFGPYEPGTFVELSEADAEWVNRDSPGTLTEKVAIDVVGDDAVIGSEVVGAANRQHKGGRKRAGA